VSVGRIEICCNDPDNGLFEGRAMSMQVGDLELMSRDWRGPKLRETADSIVIAGTPWPITASKEWFGNWCWNAYWLREDVIADFLIWAHRRDFWQVACAEERVFNLWKRPPGTLSGHRDFLARYFAKPSTYTPA
jgi:hypothetical protein